ncbi:MAG: HD domain-containing protein [Acidimicrobiia bacterium]|nr:HD domain-containing protein [Acidimicrobiia bacterium]
MGLLAALLAGGAELPKIQPLVIFSVLLVVAANADFSLPSAAEISPCFMAVLASIAAFGSHGVVLGAAIVGLGGGLRRSLVHKGRYTAVLFDCSQYLIASAAAASLYIQLEPVGTPAAFAGAVAAFATVNVVLVLLQVSFNHRLSVRSVWSDMYPELPNYLAFGLLGVLVGELYRSLGPVVIPLLVIPAAIARQAFASFLELRAAHDATVKVFIRTIEAKDEYTAGHTERVAKYALYIGEELRFSAPALSHLRYAALLHDVGKLAVPRRILNKPGRLTEDEYCIVQRHNQVCVDILTRVDFMRSMVGTASDRHAHFNVDEARERDRLVQEAHIVAVADAFDAMTSTRSYRRALSQDVAFEELRDKSGSQFNPECVEALIRAIERRGERYGKGYEEETVEFDVPPPVVGVGSAGLGDLIPHRGAPS